jgi:hypothetical protein
VSFNKDNLLFLRGFRFPEHAVAVGAIAHIMSRTVCSSLIDGSDGIVGSFLFDHFAGLRQ